MTQVELRQMLNKVSMKKEQDPASIFEQLSSIKNRYNTKKSTIDEADLIAVVLDAAPKEYQAVLTNGQLCLTDALTLENLSVAMNAHWRNINKSITQKSDGETEIVLSAFGGVCFVCNKRGHKAHECSDKKANSYRGPGGNPGGSDNRKVNAKIVVVWDTSMQTAGNAKETRVNAPQDTR